MRPRPKKVKQPEQDAVEEKVETKSEYKRCAGCVSKKMCDDTQSCMHGNVKPKGKKNGKRRDGRLPAK